MEFYRKYELIEPLPARGQGHLRETDRYRGVRWRCTCSWAETRRKCGFAGSCAALPPPPRPTDRNRRQRGTPYVVTAAPPICIWSVVARAGTVSAATGSEEVLESGFVEDPNGSGRRARAGPSARDPAPAPAAPGSFTGLFQAPEAAAPSSAGSGEAQTSDAAGG